MFSTFYWEFVSRNCAKQNNAKAQFCAKLSLQMIAQSANFSHKNVAQRNQKSALSFAKIAQKFYKWKPYITVILYAAFMSP